MEKGNFWPSDYKRKGLYYGEIQSVCSGSWCAQTGESAFAMVRVRKIEATDADTAVHAFDREHSMKC